MAKTKHSSTYPAEVRVEARRLAAEGKSYDEIKDILRLRDKRVLSKWRRLDEWGNLKKVSTAELHIRTRMQFLLGCREKTPNELEELRILMKEGAEFIVASARADMMRRAEVREVAPLRPGEVPGNPKPAKGTPGRKPIIRNNIKDVSRERLAEIRQELFFPYQKLWHDAKESANTRRTRFILKSRQIGATYYFAWEALENAIVTGDNQIFLSASRNQAEVFRSYMVEFAKEHLEVDLTGNPIILSNGAEIRFLSTNARTAQSYHGHLYIDEVFWIPNFAAIWRVASGMTAHAKWRRTLFSTPSCISHQAYPFWSGETWNARRKNADKVDIDLSLPALRTGVLGPDRIWRHVVDIESAARQGCNLFDLAELREEYSPQDFRNLFKCEFVDDAQSVFALADILRCGVDSNIWGYDESAPLPYGKRPVALGYDPSRSKDDASLTIMGVPVRPGDKWRLLKRMTFRGQSFAFQAARIRDIVESHNVVHLGIDCSGMGYGVYELVQGFYPLVQPINYSVQTKTALVLKGLDVVQSRRLEFDAGDKDLTQALMMVRQTTTDNGLVTYSAARTNDTGHADAAWSLFHALIYEPLDAERGGIGTTVAFSK